MRKLLLFTIALFLGYAVTAQAPALKPNIKAEKAIPGPHIGLEINNNPVVGQTPINKPAFKATDVISIIDIGTSANAYGQANGGRANLNLNNEINVVSNFHRMGGNLDPGGYSGDLGFESSADGGMDWNPMMYEVHVAIQNTGGEYYIDAGRYPQHGLYNPPGNTDPNEAYIVHFAAALGASNGATWGAYVYGRSKIGDPTDTTYHFVQSPGVDQFYYVPDGFCLNSLGEYWVTDVNTNWTSGAGVYLNQLMISHGVWDEATDDFVVEMTPFDLETTAAQSPAFSQVAFSPDGQIGYILALADIGEVQVSEGQSFYPVLFRTEDGGASWSDPIAVALAGDDGIEAVLNYLSDEEIAELYEAPPDREEIPFTTAFDCDISVDAWGNPHIAVVIGITGSTTYSIISERSVTTGFTFNGCFLLSSDDLGNEDSWTGRLLDRTSSFRGEFGELSEDNRMQIARDEVGHNMFMAWIDTDTTISLTNTAPDIWARGFNIPNGYLTQNEAGEDKPNNVTFGSEATFSAYYFGMGNEVYHDGFGNYTIPFTYEVMDPIDPAAPVQFKYIQDFTFELGVGIDENGLSNKQALQVSQASPNPASTFARFEVELNNAASVSLKVSNMMGQVIQERAPQAMQAGSNPIAINVSTFPSGIYFYTIEAGNESVTKKLIVK